ncbi:MAG: hypothetical protein WCK67_13100 [bacterium]
MKKFILTSLTGIFLLSLASQAFCDTVNSKNITTIGKIDFIVKGLIDIKTREGERKIWRSTVQNSSRDILTIGIFKKKQISGEVILADEEIVEIKTLTGNMTIPRWKVRDISISDYTVYIPVSNKRK